MAADASAAGLIADLERMAHAFGRGPARAKRRLLAAIEAAPKLPRRDLPRLAKAVEFLRAYPDDPRVLAAAERLVPRLPEADVVYEYSYGVVRRLLGVAACRMEIDWDGFDDDGGLQDLLDLTVLSGEAEGLADERVSLRDWIARSRPPRSTDLAFVVDRLERSRLPEPVRVHLFESAEIPVRYRGPRLAELRLPQRRVHHQRAAVPRERFPLGPFIRRPPGRASRAGASVLDFSLQALCPRKLEIYPLIYGSPADVTLVEGGRGVRIALVGVEPDWRSPLETLTFFLVLKNGVPVAYGPAAVFDGCCEMGINLFPEFRGGEIRYLYGRLMRALHHRLGADYFFLTRYGMGEDNEDALRSGAFWFYRKLGFRPTNPEVEALARSEEARRAAEPGYRSDRRMLRRLSHTEAFLDLSGGRRAPHDFAALSAAGSRRLSRSADRRRAAARCAARLGTILGLDPRARALQALAPLLALIPDLAGWPRRDRDALAGFLRAKDARSEARAARLSRNPRLSRALRQIAAGAAKPAA